MRSAPHVAATTLALAALLVFLLPVTALAQEGEESLEEGPDYTRSGAYIGFDATWVRSLYSGPLQGYIGDFGRDQTLPTDAELDVDDSWGASAIVGYRLFPILAVELQYQYLAELQGDLVQGTVTNFVMTDPFGGIIDGTESSQDSRTFSSIDVQAHVATVNFKAILPSYGWIQPYLLGGVGLIAADVDDSDNILPDADSVDFAGRVGIGFDWYLTENLVLNANATSILTTFTYSGRATPDTGIPSSGSQIPPLDANNELANFLDDGVDDFDRFFFISVGLGLQYRF